MSQEKVFQKYTFWNELLFSKALQKTEFSKFFIFASFRIVPFSKFRNFSEKSGFSELAKILEINLGQKQGFPNIPNSRNIQNLFYSKFSENYKKWRQNRKFEYSSLTSVCRAILFSQFRLLLKKRCWDIHKSWLKPKTNMPS